MKIVVDTTVFTEEEILANAKHRGYQETITKHSIDENGSPVETEVPNPVTPLEFIAEKGKELIDNWLSERLIQEARQTKREEEQAIVEGIKASISSVTSIEE